MQATHVLAGEHQLIRFGLDLLEEATQRVSRDDTAAVPAARDLLEFFWFFADRLHQGKEEDLLFPALEAAGLASEGGPAAVMLAEHAEERAALHLAWDLARSRIEHPADMQALVSACNRFTMLLRAHLTQEEKVLFPMVERALDTATRARLAEAFQARVERDGREQLRCEELLSRARDALRGVSEPVAPEAAG